MGALLLVAFAFVAPALLGPGTAQAAFPGENGRIAFSSSRDGDPRVSEIYVMNRDGSGQTFLTCGSGFRREFFNRMPPAAPAWSPEGRGIAVSRHDGDRGFRLFVLAADGTAQVPVGNFQATNPSWSPDGEQITFGRPADGIFGNAIGVVNADGSDDTILPDTQQGHSPAWSPDGERIAFHRGQQSGGDIWVMNAGGTDQVNLTRGQGEQSRPNWQRLPAPGADLPPRQFCFEGLRRNTNRGIARLAVRVAAPGRIVLQRRPGVKRFAQAHRAAGPGRVVLRVRPRGRARQRLDHRTTRLNVRAQVTYRPWVGEPLTKGRRVWLVSVAG